MLQFNVYNQKQGVSIVQSHILQWINMQRGSMNIQNRLHTFNEVLESRFHIDLLQLIDIDGSRFSTIKNAQHKQLMDIIEKYIDDEFGKRVKWHYKNKFWQLQSQQSIIQLYKLIMYFSIHCQHKNSFINRILQLSQNAQKVLMSQMQKIQINLENITQIRDIIQQLQSLQQENNELKLKLQEIMYKNTKIMGLLKDIQQENKNLLKANKQLREQKCRVFNQLNIKYIQDYIDIFNKLKQQNNKLIQQNYDQDNRYKLLQNMNEQLKQKTNNQLFTINDLEDQISRLQQIINQNNSIWSSYSQSHILKNTSIKDNINISKCSTQLQKSGCFYVPWAKLVDVQYQNNEKNNYLFRQNQQNMHKLSQMYLKYNNLNNQKCELEQRNRKLYKQNNHFKQLFKQISINYSQYQFSLKACQNQRRYLLNKFGCKERKIDEGIAQPSY